VKWQEEYWRSWGSWLAEAREQTLGEFFAFNPQSAALDAM
jgi:hypothetical protein